MSFRQRAMVFGAVRLGVGAGLLLAPGFAGRMWVGPGADGPGAKVFARAIGARDALLGFRTIDAARSEQESKHWLVSGYAADIADVAATVLAWRNMTPARRIAVPLVAGAVGAFGYLAARGAGMDDVRIEDGGADPHVGRTVGV